MRDFFIKNRKVFFLLLSGTIMSLTVLFPRIGFLQWCAMIPAAVALIEYADNKSFKLKNIYGRSLLYFWPFYAIAFHWFIYMYPLDFVGLDPAAAAVVVVLACVGLSFLQALFSAFAFVIFAAFSRSKLAEKLPYAKPFAGAAAYVVAEWFQTVGWWGVPWCRVPIGQVSSPIFLRGASLFGSYFITFIIVAVNFCLAYAILKGNVRRVAVTVAIALFAFNLALGCAVTLTYSNNGDPVKIAVLQGNISSSEGWGQDRHDKTIWIYDELTTAAASNGAKLVLWPETVFPYDILYDVDLKYYVKYLATSNETTVIASAFSESKDSDGFYNSLVEVEPDGSFGDMYHKQHLVPFGEYVPMRKVIMFLVPPLASISVLGSDLAAGYKSLIMDTEIGRVGCAICYDSIFEEVIINSCREGAELLAISTNDSWFSNSAALDMHNSQARLRAIESGKYVIRAANTGISSIIDPMGNLIDSIDEGRSGYIVED